MRGRLLKLGDAGETVLEVEGCLICGHHHTASVEVVEERFKVGGWDYLCWSPCPNDATRVLLLSAIDPRGEIHAKAIPRPITAAKKP